MRGSVEAPGPAAAAGPVRCGGGPRRPRERPSGERRPPRPAWPRPPASSGQPWGAGGRVEPHRSASRPAHLLPSLPPHGGRQLLPPPRSGSLSAAPPLRRVAEGRQRPLLELRLLGPSSATSPLRNPPAHARSPRFGARTKRRLEGAWSI